MADCFSAPGLMPFEHAKKILLDAVKTVEERELIAITDADKRVLAEAITSPINVPAHNNSAMDGYALRDDNLDSDLSGKTEFNLIGTAYAGAPFDGQLADGECIRIMTGAVVPVSVNTVIMQENVTQVKNEVGSTITLSQPTKLNNNIRFAGEDIAFGQQVFNAGHLISAVDIGLMASLGLPKVNVLRKLNVAVFSTGDELKLPGQPLNSGDIYESNSQVLIAMLQRMNVNVIPMGIIPDTLTAIKDAFIKADLVADAVISSGGVSVGEADYTKAVLDELGNVDFWKVAMKPGKPFAFGKLPNSVFFGLPGNPVSATVTFHQLARPALIAMAGYQAPMNHQFSATLTAPVRKKPGRMDFQRGVALVAQDGQLQVAPHSAQGSGILSSISRANCFIVLSQDSGSLNSGDKVVIEMFDGIIR